MEKPLFLLQWHVTAKCDQHCKHCYMYDEPTYESELRNELGLEDCRKVIDDFVSLLKRWDARGRINFTGGDPLLRKDFFEILDYAHKNKISLGIMGNPYHIDEETAKKLKRHGVKWYQISIDGMEKTHDFLRRPGSFRESFRALRVLREAGIQDVVMFTLSRLNAPDLIPVIRKVAEEGVHRFGFARLCSVGTGKQFREQMFEPLEYRELLLRVHEEFERLKEKGVKTHYGRKDHLWRLLYKEMGLIHVPKDVDLISGGCGIGVNIVCILADGTVYACRRFPSPIGKVPDQRLRDIFIESPQLNRYREIEKLEKCRHCELLMFCRGCPAVAYGATGNPFAPDPQCWKEIDEGEEQKAINTLAT